jgi:hypothetical protein
MDVQALGSAVIVAPPADPAQSQTQTNPPTGSSGSAVTVSLSSAGASPSANVGQATSQDALKNIGSLHATDKSSVQPAPAPLSSSVHVAYRYVQNPIQVVVVFTDATNGQEVAQVPPEFMVKLVQFDHDKGELIDRDA